MELFDVGVILVSAQAEGEVVTYELTTPNGLIGKGESIARALIDLASLIEAHPKVNMPVGMSADALEKAVSLLVRSIDKWPLLHAAHPVPGDVVEGVTPGMLADNFNDECGTALLEILAVPVSSRDPVLSANGITLVCEQPAKQEGGILSVVTLTHSSGVRCEYVMARLPVMLMLDEGDTVELQANVLATMAWFQDRNLCPICRGTCTGHGAVEDRTAASVKDAIPACLEGSRVQYAPYAQVVHGFETACEASYKSVTDPNPHNAQTIAVLLGYVAAVVRWMEARGLNRVGGSEIVVPWYAIGCTLCAKHGLREPQTINDYGRSSLDSIKGIQCSVEDPACLQTQSSPPGGMN